MAAMQQPAAVQQPASIQSISPQQLERNLAEIARGFEKIMGNSDTPDGRGSAGKQKKIALMTLSYNFNLGCGMLASIYSADSRNIAHRIALDNRSTISRWYNEMDEMDEMDEMNKMDKMAADIGEMVYNRAIKGCQQDTRSGGKRRYRQKGGAIPDRYDIFTMILLGGSASIAITGVTASGLNAELVVRASEYVIDSVIGLAIKMGTFKQQCDSASATSWNLVQRYTIGMVVPVETCLQKIQYNEAQITLIKAALSGLAITLGGFTSYISANTAKTSVKAIYNSVKQNISIPVVNMIMRRISEFGATICNLATRRSDATLNPAEVQEAVEAEAQTQAQAQQNAILDVNEQIKQIINSGGALSPQNFNRIIEELRAEQPDARAVEGGRRRRKRATRKPKMGKKSKTMKRKSKGKSKSKARKGKKSRNMRHRTHRAKK